MGIEPDLNFMQLRFKSKLTLDLPKYINTMKTIISWEIRRIFLEVKEKLWRNAFWARSYFLATTGQVTIDMLKQYVERQGA